MASTKRQSQLQERDYAFLWGLFESRMMTLAHASQLYFQGREEAAKKRIQKLKTNGIVGERPRQPYTSSILYLTRKALSTLSQSGIIYDYPKLPKNLIPKTHPDQ